MLTTNVNVERPADLAAVLAAAHAFQRNFLGQVKLFRILELFANSYE